MSPIDIVAGAIFIALFLLILFHALAILLQIRILRQDRKDQIREAQEREAREWWNRGK